VTISPNNPTGAVTPEPILRAINALCRDRGLVHVSDEAYEYFTYDGARHFSPGSIDGAAGHTISLYSFSKAYGMAGWRVGYMVVPAALRPAILKIQDTNLICPTAVAERAALAALSEGRAWADRHRPALETARRAVRDALASLGPLCRLPPADGAFYYYPTFNLALSPEALAERLIREHGVALVPGTTFGSRGTCTLRLSYGALDPETTAEGLRRLLRGLKELA
jgi:aspartate/methionine/tyrosine aminotransferase